MSTMNNRERYQKTFSKLHASQRAWMEEIDMKSENKWTTELLCKTMEQGVRPRRRYNRTAFLCAVLVILTLSLATVAYAATDGQLVERITFWINGEKVTAEQTSVEEDGTIIYHFLDESGEVDPERGTLAIIERPEDEPTEDLGDGDVIDELPYIYQE